MKIRLAGLCLGVLLVSAWCLPAQGQIDLWKQRWYGETVPAMQIDDDVKLLRAAKLPTDDKGLLQVLRDLVPSAEDEKKVTELFGNLNAKKFQEREQATAALMAFGPKAVPILKKLMPGTPLEVRMRCERCLKVLEEKSPAMLAAAAVRLIKVQQPKGAVAALLEYAPSAPDEGVFDEVLDALYRLAITKGQPDPLLEPALKDAQPARRALAAVLLGRFGSAGQRKAVAALLDDKDAHVAFRAAQGLLASGEPSALPIVVETLKRGPMHLAEHAEEIMLNLAGKTAPKQQLAADEASRKKCYYAWREWLQTSVGKVDLGKIDVGLPLPSPEFRARDVVKQFLDIAIKPGANLDKIVRLTEVPFYQSGLMVVNTREEWEAQLKMNQPMPEGVKFVMKITKTETLTAYLPQADAMDKMFLAKFPPADVRVVHVHLDVDFGGNKVQFHMPMFVRISGARGRIFGIGMPKDIVQKQWGDEQQRAKR